MYIFFVPELLLALLHIEVIVAFLYIKNPIFVSPGHKISHDTSISIIDEYCYYKIPEPIRKAHLLATKNI